MRHPVVKFLGDADESNFCLKPIEFRNLPAFDLERETSLNGTFLLHYTKPFGKGYRFSVFEITELFFHVNLFKNCLIHKINRNT